MLRRRERRLSDLMRRIHLVKERIWRSLGIDLGPWLMEIDDEEPDSDMGNHELRAR
jgi:hypothetical protein